VVAQDEAPSNFEGLLGRNERTTNIIYDSTGKKLLHVSDHFIATVDQAVNASEAWELL
jgi:hypothetical protein